MCARIGKDRSPSVGEWRILEIRTGYGDQYYENMFTNCETSTSGLQYVEK